MVAVLTNSWALLIGMLLLMIGNGLQGTVLGLRGALEGYSASTMALVMSAYFAGFLLGSRMAPTLIQRVGHVRVFAALASLISAAFILYAAIPEPIVWALMRLLVGFCFSGVYVVAESWLNESSTNETRGQTLSVYMIVQLSGIVSAQGLVNVADAGGYTLFVVMSVLVSVSFAPILLSVSPAPFFELTKRMTLRELFEASPLGLVAAFLLGFIFAAQFGMSAVYGTEKGLSVADISAFVAAFFVGGMILQYPIGWISDRMERRRLIIILNALGAGICLLALPFLNSFLFILALAFLIGGLANPLYSLIIAYVADFLDSSDMAAASAGLIFVNGLGAVAGPFILGWLMSTFGPDSYFAFIAAVFALVAAFGLYRSTQRAAPTVDETGSYTAVMPTATAVTVEVATEIAIEAAEEEQSQDNETKDEE
ncbi:MAG: MFS transporter [Pseudomonadota bacterium]